MKLLVKKGFIDKDNGIFRNVGETVEYPEKRAKEIETRGFGKCIEEPKPTKAEPKEPKEPKRSRDLEQLKREPRRR